MSSAFRHCPDCGAVMLPWYTADASDGERFWICADCNDRDQPPLPELLWDSLEGEEMPGGELTFLGRGLYAVGSCGMLIPDYMRRRWPIVEGEPEVRVVARLRAA